MSKNSLDDAVFNTMIYGNDTYKIDNTQIDKYVAKMFGGLKNLDGDDYEKLAQAVANTADPIRVALSADGGATTRQIVEIVAAQIGLVLGAENKSFDSFRFVEAIEKGLKK